MSDWNDALSLLWPALGASVVTAVACAVVGVHVLARRMVVVGVALPQAAALGISTSFLLPSAPLLGHHDAAALIFELAAVGALAASRRMRLGRDVVAGVVFVACAALSVLLVQRVPQGLDEVRHLVEGNMLAVHEGDLARLGATLAPVLLLHALAARRLVFCTFDRESAATLGVRTGLWEALFAVSLAVTAAAGVHATGTLFVFGFLVLPPATGLLLGRTAAGVFGVSVAAAVLAAAGGFAASYEADTPTGPTCCAAALALFLVAAALRRLPVRSAAGSGS